MGEYINGTCSSLQNGQESLSGSSNDARFAVSTKGAYFSYDRSRRNAVLQGTNIAIPSRVIYGLLGPSGCGKTTLLKALSNLIKLDEGEITVFGEKPGSKNSTIPGSGLGYMPQECALYGQLTIHEAIFLFGKLHAVKREVMIERQETLCKMLKLPPKWKLISKLSEGQKRRVSLACALINNPRLLILDEPTVGVDPLLRKAIWNIMVGLTQTEGTTIIITTHYIEEAKGADLVGVMRNGRVLKEQNPLSLMEEFSATTLESCLIQLCQKDDEQSRDSAVNERNDFTTSGKVCETPFRKSSESNLAKSNSCPKKGLLGTFNSCEENVKLSNGKDNLIKLQALFWRNVILLRRNWLLLAFEVILPGFQVLLCCIFIGSNLFDLPVALVNDEFPYRMSRLFIEKLDKRSITQNSFKNLSQAVASVKAGENIGLLYIPKNFTKCLSKKLDYGLQADNYTIECASIRGQMDYSNYIKSSTLISSFLSSYDKFYKDYLEATGRSENLGKNVLDFSETIYGNLDTTFTYFMFPNSIMCLAYLMAIVLTSMTFIFEKKSGIFDRFLISGVSINQIFVSHFCVQLVIVGVQMVGFMTIPFFIMNFKSEGSIILLFIFPLLQGIIGMTFGLLISSCTSNENVAINVMNGILYPMCLVSGFFWPVEAIPKFFRKFSYLTSLTLPLEAFRSVFARGWGLESRTVLLGLITSISWISIHILLTVLVLKFKK